MFVQLNFNPNGIYGEDCTVRAISIATNKSWDEVYISLCLQGFLIKNMPSVNSVWGTYLQSIGYTQYLLPRTCPQCYTVRDFCRENQNGTFILATGSHLVAAIDGNYFDASDSGDELLTSVWRRDH